MIWWGRIVSKDECHSTKKTKEKNMKRILFLALISVWTIGAAAQDEAGSLTVQPKGGLIVSSLMDWNRVKAGYCFGAELEYRLTDGFSIALSALYSDQGGNDNSNGVKSTLDLDYLNVPLMANCYVVGGLALRVGVQLGVRLRSSFRMDGVKMNMDEFMALYYHETGEKTTFRRTVFSVPVGISYEYHRIVLDMRYHFGVTSYIDLGNPLRNNVVQLTLGYKLL